VTPGVFEAVVKGKVDERLQYKVMQFEMRCTYPALGERDIFVSHFPIEGPGGIDRVVSLLKDIAISDRPIQ
jgi:hypothetical protein